MSDSSWTWTCQREIPSSVDASRDALEEILGHLQEQGWSEHEVFGIHLSVEEALVNAIRHGNGLDPAKLVRFECRVSPELIWVQISDEGDGFDPDSVPDPTDPDQLEAPSGRGIMLMRSFMCAVDYSDGGRTVTMEKRRRPPACEADG